MKKNTLILMAFILSVASSVCGREFLDLTFTTTPAGGKYAPRHVHAVWVEQANKTFIKTLGRWGKKKAYNLAIWNDTDGTAADGITGATPRSHGVYKLSWNLRGRNGKRVPHGTYKVWFELTDHNLKNNKFNRTALTFEHNGTPGKQNHASKGGYKDILLEYRVVPDAPPKVAHLPVTVRTKSSATLAGRVADAGGDDPTVRIYWGDKDGGSDAEAWDHVIELGVKGEEEFSTTVNHLTEGHTYYFRCYARNSEGEAWSPSSDTFVPVDRYKVIAKGDPWKYFEGKTHPGITWHHLDFDDESWKTGRTGIGYGDGDDATLLVSMEDGYLAVYTRKTFQVEDASKVQKLQLLADYDDGFVCFLNGQEVARRNVPVAQDHRTATSSQHEAGESESVDLSPAVPLLRTGWNVLAIEVHNASLGSSDLSLIPELIIWGGR